MSAIVRLYTDRDLWNRLALNARETAQQYAPQAVRAAVQAALDQVLLQEVVVGIDFGHPAHTP